MGRRGDCRKGGRKDWRRICRLVQECWIMSTERFFFASASDEMGRLGPPPNSRGWPSLLGKGDGTGGLGDRYRLRQLESVRATETLSPESFTMGDCDKSEVLITTQLAR